MPLVTPHDPVIGDPRRILVAGTSGSGKTMLAARVGALLQNPHVEIDALFHGPDWTPRPTFEDDVRRLVADPARVSEWQYSQVRELLATRTELLVWLDLSHCQVMKQVVHRTLRRRLRRQVLWNGNVEPPLWTIFTDPEHIVRWAWSTHSRTVSRVGELRKQRPNLDVIRLRTRSDVEDWVRGPLLEAASRRAPQVFPQVAADER